MAEYPVTLQLPEHLYERLHEMAEAASQPVEAVAIQYLESTLDGDFVGLPSDEQQELMALNRLSDDALWTIAGEQMPHSQLDRMSLLLALNKRSTLTDAETAELDVLLARGDRLMLRKAEAAAILTRRGYQISRNDLA